MKKTAFYQEIKNQKNQSIFLLNAEQSEIYMDGLFTAPHMGFTTSLEPQLNKDVDKVNFNNSSKIVFILDMHLSEIEQLIIEAKQKLASEMELGKDSILDTIHLATSFLIWKIPQSDKYLAIIDCKDSDNLFYWMDKKIKVNVFFKCMHVSLPNDIGEESRQLFFKHNIKKIVRGIENKDKFWDLMTRLDRAEYEIYTQKNC